MTEEERIACHQKRKSAPTQNKCQVYNDCNTDVTKLEENMIKVEQSATSH